MVLNAISVFGKVFGKVYKWSPEKIVLQKHHSVLQKSENRQVTRFTMYSFPP